jgi:glycyl-tRNA synthetase beta chain
MTTFLLEVGTEELPASFVSSAIAQWQRLVPQSLAAHHLGVTPVQVYGTPRRLAVLAEGLPPRQSDRVEEIKGPPASSAFKDGQPTQAAIGFAKKQGVDVEELQIKATDKGDFTFIQKSIPGQTISEVLTTLVPEWIRGLEGKRFMRWSDGDLRFSRPIRWLVALVDQEVLPLELANGSGVVRSDRLSWGHRVLHPEPVSLTHAQDYPTALPGAFVIVDPQTRREAIATQVQVTAAQVGGQSILYPDLLQEVVDLVEYPTAVLGKFDQEFLALPAEVITEVMISQQRYFPVFQADGQTLLPYFITISNGDPAKSAIIAAGNERVIRARLADGQYFYRADCAKSLESYLPKLETVTFQEDLGTVRAKVDRIVRVAELVCQQLDLGADQTTAILRAALLCKADLVTQMVYEFPELQGIMGEKYALASQENPVVARAIREHYQPRNAEDQLPQSLAGQVVGIADRLDTLVSIFSLGMVPTGSSDPFALRRAANAVVSITWAFDLAIDLGQLLEQLQASDALREFFRQRIRTQLQEEGIDYDLINAVLNEDDPEQLARALQYPLDVRDRARFLHQIRTDGRLGQIYETINRSARLAGPLASGVLQPEGLIQPQLFQKPSEPALYEALIALGPQTEAAKVNRDYQQLFTGLVEIAPAVSRFFDGESSVLVMDENPEIRQNRLNLLALIRNHAAVLADFGAIVKP